MLEEAIIYRFILVKSRRYVSFWSYYRGADDVSIPAEIGGSQAYYPAQIDVARR